MQHDFILLDRSGSMGSMWVEAISSINAYVAKLAADNVNTGVTLALFDKNGSNMSFDILRDRITPQTWKPVEVTESMPRGFTPLNDATFKIIDLADKGGYDKVAIIIMTDGLENASVEYKTDQIKKLLDERRAKGWQVIFLGANFDNAQQASSYGAAGGQTVNSARGNMRWIMSAMASKRGLYGSSASTDMNFTEEEKAEAKKQKFDQNK